MEETKERQANLNATEDPGLTEKKLKELVEDFFNHNYRDITARRTIEWGKPQTDENGNVLIRYKYEATIWGKDKIIEDKVWTFDRRGNFLWVRKAGAEDIYSLAGAQALIENFFANNYRDITARKTIEWGEPVKDENSNVSIRYKYEATIWGKDKIIDNKIFTFDKNGKYVSAVNVQGFPQKLDVGESISEAAINPQKPAGKLEFRIVPNQDTSGQAPFIEPTVLKDYTDTLLAKGPDDQIWGSSQYYSKYKWVAYGNDAEGTGITVSYNGKRFGLLCNEPKFTMLADHKWGLQKAYVTQDGRGEPAIKYEFDTKGGELFYELTGNNIKNRLAIIIDDEIYSAPQIVSAISREGIITGNFSQQQAEQIAENLQKGMSAVNLAARAEGQEQGRARTELAYDDGTSAGKWTFSGGGHGVKFTGPAKTNLVTAVRIYGSRYGEFEPPDENFDVWICDESFNIIENFQFPYSTFEKRGYEKWATLEIEPTKVRQNFAVCVAFDPHQTKGIYMYYDAKDSGHSYQGIPPEMKPFKDGDWLIRVVVQPLSEDETAAGPEPSAKTAVQRDILANDDGKSAGKWSFSGGGHGVKFTAPAEGCILKAVKLYGSRYGEYETPKEDFDVWLCDKNFNIIKNFKFPYSTFAKRGYTKWATLKVDDVELPKEFAICMAFDPHQTKGIYVYHDAKSNGLSYQGIPPEMEPFKDGDWMIRAIVETPGGKAASGTKPSQANRMEAENLASDAWKLWAEHKLAEAEDMFRQAVEKDPTNANAWNGLGWSQQNQGKKENARYSFERCLELEPKHAAALNGLGWIAKSEGKTDDAIEYWKKAVRASDGNATASLSGLTQTYMELGKYDEAVKYYQMWLKVEPNNEEVKDGLAKAQAMRQK
jgi:RNA polymerase sigma-70 factor (ECF subfamily)